VRRIKYPTILFARLKFEGLRYINVIAIKGLNSGSFFCGFFSKPHITNAENFKIEYLSKVVLKVKKIIRVNSIRFWQFPGKHHANRKVLILQKN
jgi:hypothetical protein